MVASKSVYQTPSDFQNLLRDRATVSSLSHESFLEFCCRRSNLRGWSWHGCELPILLDARHCRPFRGLGTTTHRCAAHPSGTAPRKRFFATPRSCTQQCGRLVPGARRNNTGGIASTDLLWPEETNSATSVSTFHEVVGKCAIFCNYFLVRNR